MLIAILNWLILIVLFIFLSLTADASRKQYIEMQKLIALLSKKGKK